MWNRNHKHSAIINSWIFKSYFILFNIVKLRHSVHSQILKFSRILKLVKFKFIRIIWSIFTSIWGIINTKVKNIACYFKEFKFYEFYTMIVLNFNVCECFWYFNCTQLKQWHRFNYNGTSLDFLHFRLKWKFLLRNSSFGKVHIFFPYSFIVPTDNVYKTYNVYFEIGSIKLSPLPSRGDVRVAPVVKKPTFLIGSGCHAIKITRLYFLLFLSLFIFF